MLSGDSFTCSVYKGRQPVHQERGSELASVKQPLFMEPLPFPLSSRVVVTFSDFRAKGLLIDVPTAPTTALALGIGPLLLAALSFLSSRAKPRDLQFRGPVLETRNTILKQKCHLACPGVPWDRIRISCHAALDIAACVAFVKESSMKCANATKFHRKSGL